MACRILKSSLFLWNSVYRVSQNPNVMRGSFVLTRNFHVTDLRLNKKQKREAKV
jgi:hypothetical protein